MKTWLFKIKQSPQEVRERLQSLSGFVVNTNSLESGQVKFSFRKRFLYPWYISFQNWTVVNGVISQTKDETQVEVAFSQHLFIQLILISHLLLGLGFLAALLTGYSSNNAFWFFSGALFTIGFVIFMRMIQKFKSDSKQYKTLLSEFFGVQTN